MEKQYQVRLAILRGDKTITIDGKAIALPIGQTSGTGRQQEIYADIKARELLTELKKG